MVDLRCNDLTFCHCFLLLRVKHNQLDTDVAQSIVCSMETYSKETKKLMDNMTLDMTSSSDMVT
jgi:hypothetical protein